MAEGSVEDMNSVVESLVNMFGGALSTDAIITVVESCGGDLNLSVDAIMKITNDNSILEQETQNNEIINQFQSHVDIPYVGNVEATPTQYQNVPPNSKPTSAPGNTGNKQPQPTCQLPPNSYSMAMRKAPDPAIGNHPAALSSQRHGAVPKVRTAPSSPANEPWNAQIRRIVENHNQGFRILILLRGAPGSGKSYLAKKIIEMLIGGGNVNFKTHICSTDDYYTFKGRYHYNRENLCEAHTWNQNRVKLALEQGLSPVVIDNTNIEGWEMEVYARNGVENGYILEVVEPNTPWSRKVNQLVKRNSHNVPLYKIKRMLDNYQKDIDGEWLLNSFRLSYPPDKKPPVLRSMPVYTPPDLGVETSNSNFSPDTVSGHQHTYVTDSNCTQISTDNKIIKTEQKMAGITLTSNNDVVATVIVDNTEISEELVHNTEHGMQENESENDNNRYLDVIKQLDEIERVEKEWENGEGWDEGQQEVTAKKNEVIENGPKPQRPTSPKPEHSADIIMSEVVKKCEDWNDISLFMPPWDDKTVKTTDHVMTTVETLSNGTCMELGDFDLYRTSYKIITAVPRNINEYHISFHREKIPEKRMLDKSTSTHEILLSDKIQRCKNQESHFTALRKLFKNISETDLRDVFDKCMGDVNWAVEIVLDGVATNQFKTIEEQDVDIEDDCEDSDCNDCSCMSCYSIVPDTSQEPEEDSNNVIETTPETSNVPKKTSKRVVKVSDASLQLKQQIEQNVFIAESHYSDHCLKLRNMRNGKYITDEEVVQDENQPSTSQGNSSQPMTVANCDDNNELDDSDSDDDDSTATVEELEKTVNFNLGKEFISELDALFGRTDMSYPDSLMPKINIPISLLNEINALWMESLMHQLDEHERQTAKMMQEDEDFARMLAAKEAELAVEGKQPEVLDFKEIMDMDYALSLYQRDVAEWKNREPNDLAAKLTREKLYNLFPKVAKDILAELLMAHDNNFQSTVEVLLVSTGKGQLLQVKNGMNNFVMQKEMERQKKVLEEEKKALSEVEWPLLPTGEVPDMNVVNKYRDQADRHLKYRDLSIQKASEYIRRGMIAVGSYYRDLAEFHKLKYEYSNSLAAASLMQLHASKCPDSATIDLHFLRVGEAREALDLFIDTHIQKLKSKMGQGPRNHTLYFITGRGLHSKGKPRIKPAVKKRLRERGLNCSEVNPGLLSAKVCADDKLTHQMA